MESSISIAPTNVDTPATCRSLVPKVPLIVAPYPVVVTLSTPLSYKVAAPSGSSFRSS